MKKAISIGLTLALAFGLGLSAFADTTVTGSGGTGEVPLKGKVLDAGADVISVAMPASIDFQVVTKNESGTLTAEQVIGGTGTFQNNGTCEVELSVSVTTAPSVNSASFLDIVDLALSTPGADNLLPDDAALYGNFKLTASLTDLELGSIAAGASRTVELKGRDNAANNTALVAGDYTIATTFKVVKA